MNHLTDEQMIDHHFHQPSAAVENHLKTCPQCAAAYAALQNDLTEWPQPAMPVRDASYGQQVWNSIAPSLAAYTPRPRRWLGAGLRMGLVYATSCAVLVGGAFYAGRFWEKHKQKQEQELTAQSNSAQNKQKVILVVLGDHLDRSERLLVELKHADGASAETVAPIRDEARTLLAANRVCRKDAAQMGDPALAGALDHLDSLLTDLSSQQEPLDPATISRLQSEMNSDGLLFEVRVLRSKIPDREETAKHPASGGTI
jgi:hypothetical protein